MISTYYLSPDGDDDWSGTAPEARAGQNDGPWRTLAGAVAHLRRFRAGGRAAREVRVEMRGGTYPVRETVKLGPEDSWTTFAAYAGEIPVVDGGETLYGWREETKDGLRKWVLELPEVRRDGWVPRQLWVNGERRPRARLPKFVPSATGIRQTFRIGEIALKENKGLFRGDHHFKPRPEDLEKWPTLGDAEAVVLHYWIEERLPQPRLDEETGWISFARRTVFNLFGSFKPELAIYYWDNLGDALTEPGEWYLNLHTHTLTYLPREGDKLGEVEIVVPRVEQFINASGGGFGRSGAGDPGGPLWIQGIRLEGIIFQHANWFQPQGRMLRHDGVPEGEVPPSGSPQAAMHLPGVLRFTFASSCAVERCTIQRIGFSGVEFSIGCRDCSVEACLFTDLGGGGVKIHGADADGPAVERVGRIKVRANRVERIGRVFHQAVGILLGHAHECVISRNTIRDAFYTGISVGWVWGYRENVTRDIRVEDNRISEIGQGVLSDLAGIYLLGVQPGTVVRGNHVSHCSSLSYGAHGIYLDEGASHILVEGNLVRDVEGDALHFHCGRENMIRRNLLLGPAEALVAIGRPEAHVAGTILHNLFAGPVRAVYLGGYAGDVRDGCFVGDGNLLAFAGELPPCRHPVYREDVPRVFSFSEWRERGFDRLSMQVPEPQFVDREAGDFRLRPGSAAKALGLPDRDWASECGAPETQTRRNSQAAPVKAATLAST